MIRSDTEEQELQTRRRLYTVWSGMKNRCDNPQNPSYPLYGGRGIRVCPEWYDFDKFYVWSLANGYVYERDSLYNHRNKWSIDRIDCNKNYCPENCRWTDKIGQARNTRQNKYILYQGKYILLYDLAKQLNIPADYLLRYAKKGATLEETIKMYSGEYSMKSFYLTATEYEYIKCWLKESRENERKKDSLKLATAGELYEQVQTGQLAPQQIEKPQVKKPKKLPEWILEMLNNNWSSYAELTKEELVIANSAQFHRLVEMYQKADENTKEYLQGQVTELYGVEE